MDAKPGTTRRFISEAQLDLQRKPGADDPSDAAVKPLWEQLQERKRKAQEELESRGKMSNFVKQIDEDEFEFLEEIKGKQDIMEDTQKQQEEDQLRAYRDKVSKLVEYSEYDVTKVPESTVSKPLLKKSSAPAFVKLKRDGNSISESIKIPTEPSKEKDRGEPVKGKHSLPLVPLQCPGDTSFKSKKATQSTESPSKQPMPLLGLVPYSSDDDSDS